jgi:hypothetical protein
MIYQTCGLDKKSKERDEPSLLIFGAPARRMYEPDDHPIYICTYL